MLAMRRKSDPHRKWWIRVENEDWVCCTLFSLLLASVSEQQAKKSDDAGHHAEREQDRYRRTEEVERVTLVTGVQRNLIDKNGRVAVSLLLEERLDKPARERQWVNERAQNLVLLHLAKRRLSAGQHRRDENQNDCCHLRASLVENGRDCITHAVRCPDCHQDNGIVVDEVRPWRDQCVEETEEDERCDEYYRDLGNVDGQEVGHTVDPWGALSPKHWLVVAKATQGRQHAGKSYGHGGHAEEESELAEQNLRVEGAENCTGDEDKELVEDENEQLSVLQVKKKKRKQASLLKKYIDKDADQGMQRRGYNNASNLGLQLDRINLTLNFAQTDRHTQLHPPPPPHTHTHTHTVISEYSTVSVIFPLTSLLLLCTGPGTHCHP